MSIIAAGTTTTTALSSTGNTDGTLQFQVNGTTASVTLNTLGAVGVGSTPNFGTAGQALVSAGSTAAPTWASVTTSPAGSNTQIQYNNGGAFGASSAFSYNGTRLLIGGVSAGTIALSIPAGDITSDVSSGSFAVGNYGDTSSELRLSTRGFTTFRTGATDGTNGTERMRISATGVISDQNGAFRAIPKSGASKTSSYTLSPTTDVGEFIEVGSGGSIVVPNATFATGDVVSIFNNTSSNVTMTMNITTAYIAGTDADKNSITLATRGVATVLFISDTVCVVNGNVT